jgi:hypothetical protein
MVGPHDVPLKMLASESFTPMQKVVVAHDTSSGQILAL